MFKAAMDHRIALRFLYPLLFLCFMGLSLTQPVAQWLSSSFGNTTMIEALAGYGVFVAGVIWLINKINRDHYKAEPDRTTPPAMSETALILNYMRQEQQSQKSVPYEFSDESVKPSDPKG
jgi:hypothetical protein